MKKLFLLTTMCILTMLFTNNAMSQVVASGTTGACTWELTGTSGNYTLTISGAGAMGDYAYGSSPWYSYRADIKTLDLQQDVTTIGNYAFYGCSGLTSVTIPNSVTTIGFDAFSYCSGLTGSLTIPNSVTTIGFDAFSYCSGLTGSLTIPNSVTTIGSEAFYSCSGLTSVTIGNSVTTIGNSAFYGCSGLTSVTIPNSVMTIGEGAFYGCSGLTSVTIPNSVTTIGNATFAFCSGLTSVTIPNSVTTIGGSAFSDCSGLTSVTIGNSVTTIGYAAFAYCSGLTSVTIPNSVTTIGNSAFSDCSGLTSVINLSLVPQIINSNVFDGVNKSNCSLTVPTSSVSAYQNAAVWQDFAPDITGGGILLSANSKYPLLGSVSSNIPNGLHPANTAVTLTATFPVEYSFLGWMSGANNLSNANPFSFTLTQDTVITADFGKPANFSLAAAGTLKNQTDIKTITHLTLTGNIDARDIQFMRDSIPFLTKLDLSGVTIVTYTGTEGTLYGSNYTYPPNEIPRYSFYNASSQAGKTTLTSVTIPNSITTIGIYAFYSCIGLTGSLTIPNSVTTIGTYAFAYCIGLTGSLTIPNSVTTIGTYAFAYCIGLTSVTIGNSVTTIGNSAFYLCYGLTSVTIPNSVTTIGEGAFGACYGLTSVTIPNSVTSIGNSAFYYCSGLTSVTIGNSVTTIGNYAFYACSDLTSVTILNSVTTIGEVAFSYCSGLTSVTIGNSVTTIGYDAFSYCSGLTSVINLSLVPQIINSNVFNGVNKSNCSLTVPTSSVSAYQNTAVWQDFAPNIAGGGILLSAKSKYPLLGSVSGNISNGLHPTNTAVTLTATFPIGNSFLGWMSGANNLSNANPFSFTLTQDTVITADFGKLANFSLAATGTLKNQTDIKTITHLTLTGNIDARDIQFMRDSMSFLLKLDLSGVTIVAYTGTEGTRYGSNYTYPANEIPPYSFYNTLSQIGKPTLASVTIPNSVTSIGERAFSYCSGLTSIINLSLVPQIINSNVFLGVNKSNCSLTVPTSSVSAYQNTAVWQDFAPNIAGGGILLSAKSKYPLLGSVSSNISNGLYPANTDVTLTATFPVAYSFWGWMSGENNLSNDNPFSFTLTQNTVITADFGKLANFSLAVAGTLKNQTDIKTITHLTLTGNIDARDVQFMRDSIPFLSKLDLSGVTIVAYTGTEGTRYGSNYTYPANEMPQYSFYNTSLQTGKTTLASVTIPNSVTSIGNSAFSDCIGLTSVTIPNSVTSIGSYAFYYCIGLTSIINLSLVPQIINSNVFYGVNKSNCSLTVPTSSVSAYQNAAVWQDFAPNITGGGILLSANSKYPLRGSVSGNISNGLHPVNTSITLTATGLVEYNFLGWMSGENNLSNANPFSFTLTQDTVITADFGKLANFSLAAAGTLKNQTDIKNITHLTLTGNIDARDIQFMRDSIPFLTKLDLSGVTIVAYTGTEGTLYGSNYTYPPNEIPPYSFNTSSQEQEGKTTLASVTIPNSVTSIGSYAFYYCSGLTSVTIGNSVTTIKNYAFASCYGLTSVTIPNSVTTIGECAFFHCIGLTSVTIGNSVTTIGDYAFSSCTGLTSVTIPNSVTTIKNSAFASCIGLTSVTIPNSVTTIGEGAFYYCSGLTSVTIGNSVTTIGEQAFYYCIGLTSVTIPNSVTSIGYGAFSSCRGLTSVTIGNSVTTIKNSAFASCYGLTSVINLSLVPQIINSNVFNGVNKSNCSLTVPTSSVSAYQNAAVWQDFAPNITGGGILLSAKSKYPFLGSVSGNISNGLYPANTVVTLTATFPIAYSFWGWMSGENNLSNANPFSFTLTQDTVITADFDNPGNFSLAAAGTLKNQTDIKTISHLTLTGNIDARDIQFMRDNIPFLTKLDLSGVTIVAYTGTEGTLYGSNYTYPANEIPPYSFFNTLSQIGKPTLASVTIPNSVTSIGYDAFYGCIGLTSVTIPNSVTSIGGEAFSSCIGLTSVTIGNSVTTIGNSAFSWCIGLTSVTIGNSVTTIENSAFKNCIGLTSVTIPNSATTIGAYAFEDCIGLTSVINLSLVPQIINSTVFDGVNKSNCSLTVPTSSVSAYQNAAVWQDFAPNITGGGILLSANSINPLLGSVSGNISNGLYPANTNVTLTATFPVAYSFWGWMSGANNLSNANPFSFTLTQDTVITADFGKPANFSLAAAGTLKNQTDITTITHLTLTGNIDARDIQFMRDSIPFLTKLDLSGVTIVAYTGTEGTLYGSNYTYPINEIPQYSFYNASSQAGKTTLVSVTIPNSVTTIGNSAFEVCSGLTSVTIGNSVTTIGDSAFYSCSGLTGSLTIPNSVTSIGGAAFFYCIGLTSVTIPNSVTTIGDYAFYSCSGLTSVTIGNSVTTIGDWAFYSCIGLTSLTIGNSVTTIGEGAFRACRGLTSVTIGNSVTTIGYAAFASCRGLTSVTIGNSVTTIGDAAFNSCIGLTSVTIPNSVTTIGDYAFSNCRGLTSLTIGNSVTTIGEGAFASCSSLTELYVKAQTPPALGYDVFSSVPATIPVHVPCGTTSAYQSASGWSRFSNYIDDLPLLNLSVQSNDATMGTATIIQSNSCTDNTAIIQAVPNYGYHFVEWHDGITQNPRTITVIQDTTFTALFEASEYQVLLSSNDASRGTLAGNGTYTFNSVATISATANTGYRFVFWNDGNTDNLRDITVTQDTAFIALFGIEDMYYVYAAPNNPTMGSVTGSDDYGNEKSYRASSPIFKKEYAANSVAFITAIPNNGYRFVQWNDGNTDNPREFTVTGDSIFTAIFDIENAIEDMATSTISIYPNPATDNINITLPENTHQALFTLYDMQGKALIRKNIGNRDVVSVSGLATGIYVYWVRTETMSYTGKVVKE